MYLDNTFVILSNSVMPGISQSLTTQPWWAPKLLRNLGGCSWHGNQEPVIVIIGIGIWHAGATKFFCAAEV